MKKHSLLRAVSVICFSVLVIITLATLYFAINLNRDMEYHIVTGENESIELFAQLSDRVTGYSVSRTHEKTTFTVHLNEKHSGKVILGLHNKSGSIYNLEDPQAHAGGKAWLRYNEGKFDVEYFQLNYF